MGILLVFEVAFVGFAALEDFDAIVFVSLMAALLTPFVTGSVLALVLLRDAVLTAGTAFFGGIVTESDTAGIRNA